MSNLETYENQMEHGKANVNRLLALIDNIEASILVESEERRILFINQQFLEMFSIPVPKEMMLGQDCSTAADNSKQMFLKPEEFVKRIDQILQEKKKVINEELFLADGRVFERDYVPIFVDDLYKGHYWSYRNITKRKKYEETLKLSDSILQNVSEAIILTDVEGVILTVNPAFTQITGYSQKDAVGKKPNLLKSGNHDSDFYADLWESLLEQGHWQGEIWNRRKNGEVFPAFLSINVITDEAGKPRFFSGVLNDITRSKQFEEKIMRKAYYDTLTELPNRALFTDRLYLEIEHSFRDKTKLAIIFMDMDGFKSVNDRFGHHIGDQLLKAVAIRLQQCIRKADTVARLGGDEFTVLLSQIEDQQAAETIAGKIIASLQELFTIEENEIQIGCSLGLVLYPDVPGLPEELLQFADKAMYQVKKQGKNHYKVWQADND